MAKILNVFLKVLFVLAVTALAWFNLSASVMAVCAVVLVVLGGKLESLVEFSFGPLKAKIERNLSESERLLENLKNLAVIQARAANSASVWTGRFASGDDWIFQSVKRVENGLRQIGVSEDQIIDARSDFVRLTIGDAALAATGGNYVPGLGPEIEVAWRKVREVPRDDPDAIEEFLRSIDRLEPDRLQQLDDMRWMIENRDVRDVDQYMRAHKPVPWKEGQA